VLQWLLIKRRGHSHPNQSNPIPFTKLPENPDPIHSNPTQSWIDPIHVQLCYTDQAYNKTAKTAENENGRQREMWISKTRSRSTHNGRYPMYNRNRENLAPCIFSLLRLQLADTWSFNSGNAHRLISVSRVCGSSNGSTTANMPRSPRRNRVDVIKTLTFGDRPQHNRNQRRRNHWGTEARASPKFCPVTPQKELTTVLQTP